MTKIRRALVVSAAAVVLVLGFGAVPAWAAFADCWVGYVCLWNNPSAGGSIYRIPVEPRGTCHNVVGFNDIADSAYNRMTTRYVTYYKDANCTGHALHDDYDGCSDGPFPPGDAVHRFYVSDYSGDQECAYHTPLFADINQLTSVYFN